MLRCINPGHADEHPSAVIYMDSNAVYCPVCAETWDVFEVAGLIDGLTTFPDKLKAVQDTLGDSQVKPAGAKPKKKARPKPPPLVALKKARAQDVFNPTELVVAIKKFKLLDGDVRFVKVWPYYNADGLIELFDVRFENEHGKKAVISYYWDGNIMRIKGAPILLFNRQLIATDTDTPILIVEGAKAAEAAEAVPGFIPVTWNGGGKKCKQVDWSVLENRTVYVYPDDDWKRYPDDHREHPGEMKPWYEQPGMETAFMLKSFLPQAKIIMPLPAAREIKSDGADIVEALEIMSADDLSAYILTAPEIVIPEPKSPAAPNPIDTPREIPEPDAFPFRILGVADDGKGYFLDRHERLTSMPLGGITQNKLLTLAPLTWWTQEFGTVKGMNKDDWTAATDAVIQISGQIDFDPDRIRGRGAWREKDGRICYHDGVGTIGQPSQNRLYLRMTHKDIGINSPAPDINRLTAILDAVGHLSFETRADMIRCIGWATLAPFAGALPWRPAGLLTGRSESGKSTIIQHLINPIAMPMTFSGGYSTEAGIRQHVGIDSAAVVIDEAESDSPKKKQNREGAFSLMRQSTSDEAPKVAKGTIDGKGLKFTLRSMFMFAGISPEVESIADDNRLFRINLESKGHSKPEWIAIEQKLIKALDPEICAQVRALTWTRLKDIFTLADTMSPVIQKITHKSSRFATAESLLFAAYQVVWKQAELTEDDLHTFFEQIYDWQPVEETRNEEEELLDRLLDYHVREGQHVYTLRQLLKKSRNDPDGMWKNAVERHGIRITKDGDLAIAKNYGMIAQILDKGAGYQRMFFRHPMIKDKTKSVSVAGSVRNCLTLKGEVLNEGGESEGPF